MKERPILFSGPMIRAILDGRKTQTRRIVKGKALEWLPTLSSLSAAGKRSTGICPYGYPGDRLWVRETWAKQWDGTYQYAADEPHPGFKPNSDTGRWKPSIHMPRSAYRITLEITNVRVERLQQISEEDAKAEGVRPFTSSPYPHKGAFCTLWQHINGPESWAENPFVWVVEFKRIEP